MEKQQRSQQLIDRAKEQAIAVINLADALPVTRSADVMARQIIRSAASVGANYRAACRARSHAEFVSKMHDVQEEADETQYWLELLFRKGYIERAVYDVIAKEASELTAIFTASYTTARKNRV
ncbi:MAG: four helix bundle protein [Bacteroidetes bacterium]|nr:MAG: four helix bundle protein [Bacteroidota bacterium]